MTRTVLVAKFSMILVTCVLSIVTGCYDSTGHPKNTSILRNEPGAFLKAFSDFEFVGSFPIDNGDDNVPSHDLTHKELPVQLELNRQYVFHHRRFNSEEGNLYDELQRQLKINGVMVLESKVGPYRFIGGGEFHISFQENDIKGTIFNSLDWKIVNDLKLSEQWDPDDYVVVLKAISKYK